MHDSTSILIMYFWRTRDIPLPRGRANIKHLDCRKVLSIYGLKTYNQQFHDYITRLLQGTIALKFSWYSDSKTSVINVADADDQEEQSHVQAESSAVRVM